MNLSTLERVVLMSILPAEGKLIDYRVLRDLKLKLAFTEEEVERIKLNQDGSKITWVSEANLEGFECGQRAQELIVEALKKLDDEGKVNDQNFALYEKFKLVDVN